MYTEVHIHTHMLCVHTMYALYRLPLVHVHTKCSLCTVYSVGAASPPPLLLPDLSSCLTVHVCSLLNCYSLSVAKCKTISSAMPTNLPPLSASLSYSVSKTTIRSGPDPQQCGSITRSEADTQPGPWLDLANIGCVLGSQNIVSSGGESEQVEEGGGMGEGGGGGVEGRSEEGEGGGREVEEGGEVVMVLFSVRCAKYLNLQVGSLVRIHPPW